jgi:hypothetical protein
MQPFAILLSGILKLGILTGIHPVLNVMQDLFNGQFPFIIKFFGEVVLVFIIGGIVGTFLHLDKAYKSDSPDHFQTN